jgi:hypothetical protein
MRLHRKSLAMDKMLARMMKVVLPQSVPAVPNIEGTAVGEIELDGVPVVSNRLRTLGPTDFERRLPGANWFGEINGRLLCAG